MTMIGWRAKKEKMDGEGLEDDEQKQSGSSDSYKEENEKKIKEKKTIIAESDQVKRKCQHDWKMKSKEAAKEDGQWLFIIHF